MPATIGPARRAGLVVLALSGVVVGSWALVAPQSFYDSFPGFGRHWVAPSGPFNEHLVTDVGAAYLALTAAAVLALAWSDLRSCRLAGVVWAVFSTPHLYFHARHLDGLPTFDAVAQLTSLAGTLVIAVLLALPSPAGGRD